MVDYVFVCVVVLVLFLFVGECVEGFVKGVFGFVDVVVVVGLVYDVEYEVVNIVWCFDY